MKLVDFDTEALIEFFDYLDGLRISGVTNMMGAGAYLQSEFDMERPTARDVLKGWMTTFDDKPVADRVAEALTA